MKKIQTPKPYKSADAELKDILKKVKREFNKHRLKNFLPFDEININKLKKSLKPLYTRLENINFAFYLKIAQEAYKDACKEIGGSVVNLPDKKWLLAMLNSSDPVTEYVYTNEVGRKRQRFFEALLVILATKHTQLDIEREYQKAYRFWVRQTEQYEINSVDYARLQAFEDNGVELFIWNTQEDERVCAVCAERDGLVYEAEDIPDRHYNCRCFLTAVVDE